MAHQVIIKTAQCRVCGDTEKMDARQLCQKHYARFLRYGDPTFHPAIRCCIAPRCTNRSRVKGYCPKHAKQLRKHGYIFTPERPAPKRKYTHLPPVKKPNPTTFWRYVAVTANDNKCWEWQGPTNKKGYGESRRIVNGVQVRLAHRIAYAIAFENPGDLMVCHRCDNPPCVNPNHLFLGTNDENQQDRRDKLAKGVYPGHVHMDSFGRGSEFCPAEGN